MVTEYYRIVLFVSVIVSSSGIAHPPQPACTNGRQVINVTNTSCSKRYSNSTNNVCHLGPFLQEVDRNCPNVEITLQSGIEYTLADETGSLAIHSFTNMTKLSLTGNGFTGQRANIDCIANGTTSSGLFVQGCQRLKLQGLALRGCSYPILNFTAYGKFLPQTNTDRAAVYVEFCNTVEVVDVEISNTNGVALMIYSVNRVAIIESTFEQNGLQQLQRLASSGAVFIEAPEENSFKSKPPNVLFRMATQPEYSIVDSRFAHNTANPRWRSQEFNTDETFKTADTFQDGRGSGLQLYFRRTASGAKVLVDNCTFMNNTAMFGAGLSAYVQGSSSNNTVEVTHSTFENNNGLDYSEEDGIESGGGAIQFMITTYQFSNEQQDRNIYGHNTFHVTDCTFENNSAYFGGAVSIIASREHGSKATNKIQFTDCHWRYNRARLGSAIDCVPWKELRPGSLPNVTLQGNTFSNNTVSYWHSKTATIGGSGTVYTDSLPVSLKGTNKFVDNKGSGMTGVGALVHFEEGSTTDFIRNHATKGGGVSLYSQAKLILYPNVRVLFANNRAFLNGAAIYYRLGGPRNLMTSQNCFIQYHDMTVNPHNWTNVTMEYECNIAEIDNSTIFTSSLLPCVWTGAPYGHGLIVNKTQAIENAINHIITQNPNSGCHNDVNTDSLWANESELKHIMAYPGQKIELKQSVRNELQNESYSVFRGDSLQPELGNLRDSQYISQMELKFSGKPYSSFDIKLTSPWTLYFEINSKVTLTPCAPGFDIDGDVNEEKETCYCTAKTNEPYEGINSCNSSHAEMHSSFWAGYMDGAMRLCSEEEVQTNRECQLYTGFCALGHCNMPHSLQYGTGGNLFAVRLPNKPSNSELKEIICGRSERKGILCSKCVTGYAPELNSFSTQCVPCNASLTGGDYVYAGMVWLSARFIPIALMVAVFLLFDIDILTGSMQCFIFYSQVVTYLTTMMQYSTPKPLQTMVRASFMGYDIWKLRFGRYIYEKTRYGAPSICFPVHNLTLAMLEYLSAILPFVIIISLWFCKGMQEHGYCCRPCNAVLRKIRVGIHRLRRQWTSDSTIIHGLVAFVVFSYTQFLITSSKLVAPSTVMSKGSAQVLHRVKYNGSMAYGDAEHFPYLFVGILVLMTFTAIPPIILTLVPLVPRIIMKLSPEREWKIVWLCDKCFSGPKWQFFLDAFQGGFKPQFSFFSGLFFLYRIVIVVTYVLPTSPENQYFLQTVSVASFLVIHALCQPYRKRIHNILDALIYTNMLILLLMTNNLWHQSSRGKKFKMDYFPYLILVIMNLPQICLVLYILFRLLKAIRKLYVSCKLRHTEGETDHQSLLEDSELNSELTLFNDSFHARHEYVEGIDINNVDALS